MKTEPKDVSLGLALLVSFVAWLGVIVYTIFYVLVGALILFPISLVIDRGTRKLVHWSAILWARSIIMVTPLWRMEMNGLEKIDKNKTYLIVANHQSMLDILILSAGLTVPFKFLAKKELFQIPFLGWHMSLARYIAVDRSSKVSRHQALVDLDYWLKQKANVLFFPEGTRSLDGEIHDFRLAAFKIARDANVEILPVVLDGTGQALPKHSWLLKKRTCFHLSVLDPVSVSQVPDAKLDEVKETIRVNMIAHLRSIRAQA